MASPPNPLIVALDRSDLNEAEALAEALAGTVGLLKVGLELFTAAGPEAVRRIARHAPVFLDAKLHDIPNTVGRAAANLARLGIRMLNVHALGGEAMVRAAVDGAARGADAAGVPPPLILGVTVLSSLSGESLASPASLAFEAHAAGAAGAVVSGDDVAVVREAMGEEFLLVVPGIRPSSSSLNDHARVLTPEEALQAGADHLVVGRPVTDAADPAGAARSILAEIHWSGLGSPSSEG
ncbi:MAG: orotidine-5'-phosphate decarboxylase [Actinomycetota bacterium]|nr:orotidine-5'-phosphate decarboxylase [Actinomycetota bacterium]